MSKWILTTNPPRGRFTPTISPTEVAFHSAPGFSNSLQAVDFEMDVAKLSRGLLEGSFRLGGSRRLPVLSIQTNQDLLLEGNRRHGVFPLCLNTTDQQPVVRGVEIKPGSLHGFHAGLNDVFSFLQGLTSRQLLFRKRGLNSSPSPPAITRRSR